MEIARGTDEGAPRREEQNPNSETFEDKLKGYFAFIGHKESIGSAVEVIAGEAFDAGIGRDELVRMILRPEIFGRGKALEKALHHCIHCEKDLAYQRRRGQRRMSPEQNTVASSALEIFLQKMDRSQIVANFFADLLAGRTEAGTFIGDAPYTTISQSEFLKWAHSRKTMRTLTRRFRSFVEPIVYDQYERFIRTQPKKYIANFIRETFRVLPVGEFDFRVANLEKLFRDICASIEFMDFWTIFCRYLEDLQTKHATHTFFSPNVWFPSIKPLWTKAFAEEREKRKRFIVQGGIEYTRGKIAECTKLHFLVLPPGSPMPGTDNAKVSDKIILVVQDTVGRRITQFTLKETATFDDPANLRTHLKRKLHNILRDSIEVTTTDVDKLVNLIHNLPISRKNGKSPPRNGHKRR